MSKKGKQHQWDKYSITKARTDEDFLEVVLQYRNLLGVGIGTTHEAWLMRNWAGIPVGFCTVQVDDNNNVYLTGVGIMPGSQGLGLQIPLCKKALKWAKKRGSGCCYTYALDWNTPSIKNLLRSGFQDWRPKRKQRWVGDDARYFIATF